MERTITTNEAPRTPLSAIISDPVTYLAGLGIEAELVAEMPTSLSAAA